jgi:chemotaxis protein methyltransferase CheR
MKAIMENNERQRTAVISAALTHRDFLRLSELIHIKSGIKMPASKRIMIEARLRKRLRELGMKSFREYCDHLFSNGDMERELIQMIDAVTTNKTDFFREPRQFDLLAHVAIPELIKLYGAGIRRDLTVWSAGCSTGEEPYTIAMVLNEFRVKHPAFHFFILATDISTKVLDRAVRGIYKQETAETIPMKLKRKYLMRSKDREKGVVRLVPELRSQIRFRRLNFMDHDFGMREPMDIIFCRNVIIYFDRQTQEKLINKLNNHLIPGGYLFMGHSETLGGLNVPLEHVGPMVYRKPA